MDLINNKSWRQLPRVLWNHLLAASYVLVAGVVVVRFDAEFRSASPWLSSNALVTNFGDFYPTLIAYPLFFWGITVAYAVVALPSTGWKLSRLVANTVGLGLLVHVNFLCLALIGHDDLLAKLPAEMFQYYVRGVIVTCLGIVAALGFVYALNVSGMNRDRYWLPLAYVPAVNLWFGPTALLVPVLVTTGLGVWLWRSTESWAGWRTWRQSFAAHLTDWRVLTTIVFLVGVTVRLLASLRLAGMGEDTVFTNSDDASQYDQNARGILDGSGVFTMNAQPGTSSYSPGYSLFLAALYGLTGRNLTAVMTVQAVLSAFVPVGVFLVGRRCAGRLVGFVAAMLAALSQLLIFNSVNLTREMGSILLLLPLVWMLQRTPPDSVDAWKRMWIIGGLFGCIAFIDPVFLVVAAVVLVVYGLNNRVPLRQRVRLMGVLLIALYLTLMPLKLFVNTPTNWNYFGGEGFVAEGKPLADVDLSDDDFHSFIDYISGAGGASNGGATPTNWKELLSPVSRPKLIAIHLSRDYSSPATELYQRGINVFAFPGVSIANVILEPRVASALIAEKVWLDFRRFFFEGHSGYFSPLLLIANTFFSANLMFYACMFAGIGLLAMIGRIRSRRAVWEQVMVLVTLLAYSSTYIVAFFGLTRFRASMHPLLLLWIGLGLVVVSRWILNTNRPWIDSEDSSLHPK